METSVWETGKFGEKCDLNAVTVFSYRASEEMMRTAHSLSNFTMTTLSCIKVLGVSLSF